MPAACLDRNGDVAVFTDDALHQHVASDRHADELYDKTDHTNHWGKDVSDGRTERDYFSPAAQRPTVTLSPCIDHPAFIPHSLTRGFSCGSNGVREGAETPSL